MLIIIKKFEEIIDYSSDVFVSEGDFVSDCKILIFSNSSFLKSRATLRTVGLGTPNSLTTVV